MPASIRSLLWPSLGTLAVLAAGCSSSDDDPAPGIDPPVPADPHANVVLLDRFGAPLTVASTEPYSPRNTCGACHDVDRIANGYHFQQGRTDGDGQMDMESDYNSDGRYWLLSAGMLGKW
jgi:hypothetical protein